MNVIDEARTFAFKAHGGQRYGEDQRPYVLHLDAVAVIVAPFGWEAQVVAYLHDVLEDTTTTAVTIEEKFGGSVSYLVCLVTDERGKNRRERKLLTNEKLSRVPVRDSLALIVKAADRLANVRESVKGDGSKLSMYRREHEAFRVAVFRPGLCDDIWAELDRLIAEPKL